MMDLLDAQDHLLAAVASMDAHLDDMSGNTAEAYAILARAVSGFHAGATDLVVDQSERVRRFLAMYRPEGERDDAIARVLVVLADAAIKLAAPTYRPDVDDLMDTVTDRMQVLGASPDTITYEVVDEFGDWKSVVARDGGEIVGRLEFNARWGRVPKVMVAKTHRRRGIATRMLEVASAHNEFGRWVWAGGEYSEDGAAWASSVSDREVYPTWALPADFSKWMRRIAAYNQHTLFPETVYRGVVLGWYDWEILDDVVPSTAAEVERALSGRSGIGNHWTTDRKVAEAFAVGLGLESNYRVDAMSHGPESSLVGIVLEGRVDGADVIGEDDEEEWEHYRLQERLVGGESEAHLLSGTDVEVVRATVVLRDEDSRDVDVHADVTMSLSTTASRVEAMAFADDQQGWKATRVLMERHPGDNHVFGNSQVILEKQMRDWDLGHIKVYADDDPEARDLYGSLPSGVLASTAHRNGRPEAIILGPQGFNLYVLAHEAAHAVAGAGASHQQAWADAYADLLRKAGRHRAAEAWLDIYASSTLDSMPWWYATSTPLPLGQTFTPPQQGGGYSGTSPWGFVRATQKAAVDDWLEWVNVADEWARGVWETVDDIPDCILYEVRGHDVTKLGGDHDSRMRTVDGRWRAVREVARFDHDTALYQTRGYHYASTSTGSCPGREEVMTRTAGHWLIEQVLHHDGTGEGLRAVLEAEIDHDPSIVADAYDRDVSPNDVATAYAAIRERTAASLARRFPGQSTLRVWRSGDLDAPVVSVTTREGGIARFGEPVAYTVDADAVLADTAIISGGTFAEDELLVAPADLRAVHTAATPLADTRYGTPAATTGDRLDPSADLVVHYDRNADTLHVTHIGEARWPVVKAPDMGLDRDQYRDGPDWTWVAFDYHEGASLVCRDGGIALMNGSGSITPGNATWLNPFAVEALARLLDTEPRYGRHMLRADTTHGRDYMARDWVARFNDLRGHLAHRTANTFAAIDLYHGTSGWHAEQILRAGLRPRDLSGVGDGGWVPNAISNPDLVYLAAPTRLSMCVNAHHAAVDAAKVALFGDRLEAVTLVEMDPNYLGQMVDRAVMALPDLAAGQAPDLNQWRYREVDEDTQRAAAELLSEYEQAERKGWFDRVLLRVDVPPQAWRNFDRDEDTSAYAGPAEMATGMSQWLFSLGRDGVVGYRGSIPASWISEVGRNQRVWEVPTGAGMWRTASQAPTLTVEDRPGYGDMVQVVARDGDEIVGVFRVVRRWEGPGLDDYRFGVWEIRVSPTRHRQGLGTAMVDALLDEYPTSSVEWGGFVSHAGEAFARAMIASDPSRHRLASSRHTASAWDGVTLADIRFDIEDRSSSWISGKFDVVGYVDALSHLPVARMTVTEFDGEGVVEAGWYVSNTAVIPTLQRRGVASEMLAVARRHVGQDLRFSDNEFTADGAAWATSLGHPRSPDSGWDERRRTIWINGSRNDDLLARAEAITQRVRGGSGQLGVCGRATAEIARELGLGREEGFYTGPTATRESTLVLHAWNVLADGSVLDPTADQFGFDTVRLLSEADAAEWYHPMTPEQTRWREAYRAENYGRDPDLTDYALAGMGPR